MIREVTVDAFEHVLLPLGGLADDDASELHAIDSSDEAQVRAMIRTHIRPQFEAFPDYFQFAIKLSLSYFLTSTHDLSTFERPLDSLLASELNTPNPKDFYLWLWQELVPGEPSELPDIERYRVSKRGILMRDEKPLMMAHQSA
jgi:hypothetical protein